MVTFSSEILFNLNPFQITSSGYCVWAVSLGIFQGAVGAKAVDVSSLTIQRLNGPSFFLLAIHVDPREIRVCYAGVGAPNYAA